MSKFLHQIGLADVGKSVLRIGDVAYGMGFMGGIQQGDVGKRIYVTKGVLSVENNEQRDQREQKLKAAVKARFSL